MFGPDGQDDFPDPQEKLDPLEQQVVSALPCMLQCAVGQLDDARASGDRWRKEYIAAAADAEARKEDCNRMLDEKLVLEGHCMLSSTVS